MRCLKAMLVGTSLFLWVVSALAQTEIIEAPKLVVGDRWERSNGRTYEVLGDEQGHYLVRMTRPGRVTEELWNKVTLTSEKFRDPGKDFQVPMDPPEQTLLFPLTIGGKWGTTSRSATYGAHFARSYRVEAWEEVRIPVGTFKALRVRSDGRRMDTGYQFTEIYWYSPEVRGLLKANSTIADARARAYMDFELLRFTPGGQKMIEIKP
ncbi:MAG: hypothetical protein WCI75_12240 [candidate division NC10 bacterium]